MDLLVALDDHLLDSTLGYVVEATQMDAISENAGLSAATKYRRLGRPAGTRRAHAHLGPCGSNLCASTNGRRWQ